MNVEQYGKLTVVELVKRTGKPTFAKCRCECGIEKSIRYDHLKEGRVKSCGCYRKSKTINLLSRRFGKLQVVQQGPPESNNEASWLCQCDCGNQCFYKGSHLRSGKLKSCGCVRSENTRQRSRKAPYFWLYAILKRNALRGKKELTLSFEDFLTFTSMPTCHYCSTPVRWHEYDTYDKGKKVSHSYHLDRIDNTKGYSKDNCVVCCPLCNYVKSDHLSYEEMKLLSPVLSQIQKMRTSRWGGAPTPPSSSPFTPTDTLTPLPLQSPEPFLSNPPLQLLTP